MSFASIPYTLPQPIHNIKKYGIIFLNSEGNITSWNTGAESILGYSPEEAIGKPFISIYGGMVENPLNHIAVLLDRCKDLGYLEEEGWQKRKNGAQFWCALAITPIFDDENLISYSLICKDLTAKKLAGELPEISFPASEPPVLAIGNIICYRFISGEVPYPDLQWEQFTGQIWPDHQGYGWLKMHPDEEHGKIMRFWRDLNEMDLSVLQRNWHSLIEKENITKLTLRTKLWSKLHEQYRPVVMNLAPVFNMEGKFEHWVCNIKDEFTILAEKFRYKNLLEKQQLILSSSRIGLWEYDIERDRIDVDDIVAKFFAIDLSTFSHKLEDSLGQIIAEDREQVTQKLRDCIDFGKSYHAEFRIQWPDGLIHHIVEDGTAHFDEQGKVNKILGSNSDMTPIYDLIEARARAEQAEKKREEQKKFIDTICHELRNPLNGIMGDIVELDEIFRDLGKLAGLGEEGGRPLEQIINRLKVSIDTIKSCSRHQKEVIDQVLDLSAIEKGKTVINKTNFNLQAICRFLIAMHRHAIIEKHLDLIVNIPEEEVWVKNDETRFKEILINLLTNAIHYTEEGHIGLRLEVLSKTDTHTKFLITISDTGPGFTPEQMSNLFERFSSFTRRSFDPKYKGTGLGLAISKELSDLLGGHIEIKSTPGKGSSFYLTFEFENGTAPRLEEVDSSTAKASKTAINKKILIVDDGQSNRRILERIASRLGCSCIQAENGEQAILAYKEHKPDMIFMDIEMPVKGGLEAAAEIRRLEGGAKPILPIIAVSGYATEEFKSKAKAAGMTEYITKPIKGESVQKAILSAFNPTASAALPTLNTPFHTVNAMKSHSAGAAGNDI